MEKVLGSARSSFGSGTSSTSGSDTRSTNPREISTARTDNIKAAEGAPTTTTILILGAVAAMCIIIVGVFLLLRRRNNQRQNEEAASGSSSAPTPSREDSVRNPVSSVREIELSGWQKFYDSNSCREYWYNEQTMQTTWDSGARYTKLNTINLLLRLLLFHSPNPSHTHCHCHPRPPSRASYQKDLQDKASRPLLASWNVRQTLPLT